MPAVTLVTAAPAFANASTEATITLSAAAYTAQAAPTNPTGFKFNLAVTNTGTLPVRGAGATGPTVTIHVPPTAPHSNAPTFPSITGYSGPTVSGSLASGWTATYVRTSPLPVGQTDSRPNLTVTFNDPVGTSPYYRFGGLAFNLSGTLTGENINPAASSTPVSAVAASTLSATAGSGSNYIDRWQNKTDQGQPNSDPIGVNRRYYAANPTLSGGASITKITATVVMSKGAANTRWALQPRIAVLHNEWTLVGVVSGASDWTWTFETTAAAFAPTTNGGAGPIGPTSYAPFTTSTQPWNPPASRFSVLFWPHLDAVSDGTGQGSGSTNQNRFSGSLRFTTTSAGSAVSTSTYSVNLTT